MEETRVRETSSAPVTTHRSPLGHSRQGRDLSPYPTHVGRKGRPGTYVDVVPETTLGGPEEPDRTRGPDLCYDLTGPLSLPDPTPECHKCRKDPRSWAPSHTKGPVGGARGRKSFSRESLKNKVCTVPESFPDPESGVDLSLTDPSFGPFTEVETLDPKNRALCLESRVVSRGFLSLLYGDKDDSLGTDGGDIGSRRSGPLWN